MHKRGDNQTFTELKVTKNKSLEQHSETHAQLSAAPCIYERISPLLSATRNLHCQLRLNGRRRTGLRPTQVSQQPQPRSRPCSHGMKPNPTSRAAPAPALGWEAPNPNPFAVLPFPTPCPGPGERNGERSWGGERGSSARTAPGTAGLRDGERRLEMELGLRKGCKPSPRPPADLGDLPRARGDARSSALRLSSSTEGRGAGERCRSARRRFDILAWTEGDKLSSAGAGEQPHHIQLQRGASRDSGCERFPACS